MTPLRPRLAPRFAGAGLTIALGLAFAACQAGATPLPTLPPLPSVALPSSLPSGLPQAFVQFQSMGGSSVAGGAVLSETAGKTTVALALTGVDVSTSLSGTVFAGTCDNVPSPSGAAPSESAPASAAVGASPSAMASESAGASAGASAAASESPSAGASVGVSTFDLGPITGASSTATIDATISDLTSTPHAIAIFGAGGAAASAATSSESPVAGASASAGSSAAASLAPSESVGASLAPAGGVNVVACGEITTVSPSGAPSASSGASESLPAASPSGSSGGSPGASVAPSGSASY